MKAKKLADIILAFFDSKGDLITNKKIQKLVYYTEAWFLVYFGSVVDEDFEAWVHGPVVHSLYSDYKKFGYAPIKLTYESGSSPDKRLEELLKESKLTKDQKELLFEVLKKYGALSSYQLETLSHSEAPWKKARTGHGPFEACSNIIDKAVMEKYYTSLLKK